MATGHMDVFGYMQVPCRWFIHGDVTDEGNVYSARADLFLTPDDDHWRESEEDENERVYYQELASLNRIKQGFKRWSDRWYRPDDALNMVRFEMVRDCDITDLI